MDMNILFLCMLAILQLQCKAGILYPKSSGTREVLSLDGLWHFSLVNSNNQNEEIDNDVKLMPVPASYNDISTSSKVRDHVGQVKYKRSFYVPTSWRTKRVWLRFGSVCHTAEVLINDKFASYHEICHLPFTTDITSLLSFGNENSITVLVNNKLNKTTIPQGWKATLLHGRTSQEHKFPFYNYAGIDRPVLLYTTPKTYIGDITLHTTLNGTNGTVKYDVKVEGPAAHTSKIRVTILDEGGKYVATNKLALSGALTIRNVKLWWPYLMDDTPGYQYTFEVGLFNEYDDLRDIYHQQFGVRELSWDSSHFKINGKNIYLRGFGRHEDYDLRGKGLDLPTVIRDYNLIKWIGANCYRTSHYPYAEEIMDLADSQGIMIINEMPANSIYNVSDELQDNHKRSITETIRRDKNRPSVIMWSAGTMDPLYGCIDNYITNIMNHIKHYDKSRPVTLSSCNSDKLDILSVSLYRGWYSYDGHLDVIHQSFIDSVKAWHQNRSKPLFAMEYGADSLTGYHTLPASTWSEEYHVQLMSRHFQAFDELRKEGWFIGELIWNFADYKTEQSYTSPGGNKKGIFTRDRQPKAAAHFLRKRYWALANRIDNATSPKDLDLYIIDKRSEATNSDKEDCSTPLII